MPSPKHKIIPDRYYTYTGGGASGWAGDTTQGHAYLMLGNEKVIQYTDDFGDLVTIYGYETDRTKFFVAVPEIIVPPDEIDL